MGAVIRSFTTKYWAEKGGTGVQKEQTLREVRLRSRLQKEVDKQLRRFEVPLSEDVVQRRYLADGVAVNWLGQNVNSSLERDDLLFEYAGIMIATRLSKWVPSGIDEEKLLKAWNDLFDKLTQTGVVGDIDLVYFSRQITESILSPTDIRAREKSRAS